jgi:hypothetical protein
MKVLSFIPDYRIEASNVTIEITYKEYLEFAEHLLMSNEFQRKKVIKGKVRSMLKGDLKIGCTFPPIVIAVNSDEIKSNFDFTEFNDSKQVELWIKNKEIILLDGLQRTSILKEVEKEIDGDELNFFYKQKLRLEILVGLSRINILYRMLTLNTGQTTMSVRHLMEIMYIDYPREPIPNVFLITDLDDKRIDPENPNEYSFKDVLDGFYSLLEGKEYTINKAEVLDNISVIESIGQLNKDSDLFGKFFKIYHHFLSTVFSKSKMILLDLDVVEIPEMEIKGRNISGKSFLSLFKRSQALSGFGAAVYKLGKIETEIFTKIENGINDINLGNPERTLYTINYHLDRIKQMSKKIGNDQRYYYMLLFKFLFNKANEETYLNVEKAAEFAFNYTRLEKL